jgi:segregation and condensation protein A
VSEVEINGPPAGGYAVSLPTFEGPLDLLLHLCQKHELDILDIPIGFVTEKYLEYLAVMQLMNLDVASEYLVMAATLAHIKSKMLLPAPPPGQEDELAAEEEDPREALIRRLLEYQKYKHAGEALTALGVAQQNVFLRGVAIEEAVHTGIPPLAQVPLFSLVEAFQSVLSKSKVKLSHDIVHERVTLADRINELVDILRTKRRVAFEELFEGLTTRFDLVITFLALLEMTRLRMTRLFQADFNSQIFIEFTAQVTEEQQQIGEADNVDVGAGAEAGTVQEGTMATPPTLDGSDEDDEDVETTDVRPTLANLDDDATNPESGEITEAHAALDLGSLDPIDEVTETRPAADIAAFDLVEEPAPAIGADETDARPTSPQTIPAPPPSAPDPGTERNADDAGDENT